MKRIFVFLAASLLCFSVITTAYAAVVPFDNTQWLELPSGFGGGSHVYPQSTVVSYSTLQSIRSQVNTWLAQGQYAGFRGTAVLAYNGVYYIQLVQNGVSYRLCNNTGGLYRTESQYDDTSTTTVPSTTAPSTSKTETTEKDTTTVYDPTSPSDSRTELDALNRLIDFTFSQIKAINGLRRTNLNQYNLMIKMRSLMWNMIDGINDMLDLAQDQVDLLTAYFPRLDDIYNQLISVQSASWASLDMESRVFSAVSSIDSRLDSVINNGAVQVNTSSIDARLDKLISMYSKVNSVVLDTAAVNGGQIKSAVGGELKDVVFWGSARRQNSHLLTMPLNYTLADAPVTLGAPELRSIPLGASIPAYISADPVLAAGVWKSGSTYYLSDTYNVSTGEYVQRIKSIVFDGSENWVRSIRANDASLFSVSCIPDNTLSMPMWSSRYTFKTYTSAFDLADDSTKAVTSGYFSHYGKYIRFMDSISSLSSWKTWLANKYKEGTPMEVWYAYPEQVTTTYLDLRPTIAIPEGDSTISAEMLRITAKYETYDSYTQTADIINAINNIPPYDDSGLIAAITNMSRPTVTTDLTEITTRLDDILGELRSTSGSATCDHTYQQHMEQDTTCTLPGLMISTCSKCGDSYSEIVDPLGHDWIITSHIDAVTDPETGEETASAYDVYTCSRCGQTYEDHSGDGAPDEDYSNTSISKLVVQVFSKLGTFAGKLIGFFVHLLDKALTSVDNVISKFNDYTAQIGGFGGAYPSWLTGFWAIIPMELQTALTFAVICMALGAVGRKLFFS